MAEEHVVGADAMHVALRGMLRHLGHRQGIIEPDPNPLAGVGVEKLPGQDS